MKNIGRPAKDGAKNTKRYQVTLDLTSVKWAKKLGKGNLSLGIRFAITQSMCEKVLRHNASFTGSDS
jgi:hypothetical protein